MNTKLFLALMGVCLLATTPTSAATISFLEDPDGTGPITVTSDIAGATITTGLESARLSVGNVSGDSTVILRRQMTNQGTMTGEGGGGGVNMMQDRGRKRSKVSTISGKR
jgi:hypothetical protein